MLNKGLTNQTRVLIMSNNRKINHLIVDFGTNSTMIMGIKNNFSCSTDVLFIKEIMNKKIEEVAEEVTCLCNEFSVDNVMINTLGMGKGIYDTLVSSKGNHIVIREVKPSNSSNYEGLMKLKSNIEDCTLRFMQTYKCAKIGYIKSFLGYSEIMNIHNETDKLIDEMDNMRLNQSTTNECKISSCNQKIGINRLRCLLIYYGCVKF